MRTQFVLKFAICVALVAITFAVFGQMLSAQFVSENESWIVGRNGVILRSGDGGRTWVEQESGTKLNLYAMYMNKKGGWAVGSGGLVLRYLQ